MSRSLAICVCICWLSLLAGCGGDGLGRVSGAGKVTLHGVPLEFGSIDYLPENGNIGPSANAVVKEGQFEFDSSTGPTAGPHMVIIMPDTDQKGMGGQPTPEQIELAKNGNWVFHVEVPAQGPFTAEFEFDNRDQATP